MEDFADELNDTLRLLRESIRRFVEKEVLPKASACLITSAKAGGR